MLHSEVEWHPALPARLEGRATVYRGHDGVRQLWRETDEIVSEIHYEIVDVSELGDRVVAVGHIRIRGTESGAETRSPIGYVFEFKDGKVIRMQSDFDPNQALEAARGGDRS